MLEHQSVKTNVYVILDFEFLMLRNLNLCQVTIYKLKSDDHAFGLSAIKIVCPESKSCMLRINNYDLSSKV